MAQKKISRKKLLKEQDEFISTTGKVIQFFRDHQRQLVLYALIALVLLVAGMGVFSYIRWQAGKAQTIQEQAFQLYQEGISRGANPEGEKEKIKKALEKFQEALSVYKWGNVGQVSQIYIGICNFSMKEYDKAIQSYSRCLQGPFRAMALDGLGYCHEAKGDYAQALENYQKNLEGDYGPYREEAMLGMARCYEALNQKQKALEVYQKTLDKYPKSKMADFIRWKVNELKG